MHYIDPETGADRRARFLGKLPNGTRVYRCHVRVIRNEARTLGDPLGDSPVHEYTVTATSAADAANAIRDEWAPREACVEIHSWGPKGGHVYRYVGWDSHVMAKILELHKQAKAIEEAR